MSGTYGNPTASNFEDISYFKTWIRLWLVASLLPARRFTPSERQTRLNTNRIANQAPVKNQRFQLLEEEWSSQLRYLNG